MYTLEIADYNQLLSEKQINTGCHQCVSRLVCTGIWNGRRLLKIQYLIAIHLMRWLINFYDCRCKGTLTAGIGIHATEAWVSQLVNFKNTIWTWGLIRRKICNKILFSTWEKMPQKRIECFRMFWNIMHESSISFWLT